MTYDPNRLDLRKAALITRLLPFLESLNQHYFHLRVEGREHIPETPALFVANHNSGMIGPDLFCTLGVLWRALAERPLHPLAHDHAMRHAWPVGRVLEAFGAVAASSRNAERALAANASVLVYPGGELDAFRHFNRRNEIVILPRTGFARLAQKMRVPIVPIVAQGAHTSAYIFSEGKRIAQRLQLKKWARVERFPLALAAPWGLVLGPWLPYFPLPAHVRLRVLPPMQVPPHSDPRKAAANVQAAMQDALTEMARA